MATLVSSLASAAAGKVKCYITSSKNHHCSRILSFGQRSPGRNPDSGTIVEHTYTTYQLAQHVLRAKGEDGVTIYQIPTVDIESRKRQYAPYASNTSQSRILKACFDDLCTKLEQLNSSYTSFGIDRITTTEDGEEIGYVDENGAFHLLKDDPIAHLVESYISLCSIDSDQHENIQKFLTETTRRLEGIENYLRRFSFTGAFLQEDQITNLLRLRPELESLAKRISIPNGRIDNILRRMNVIEAITNSYKNLKMAEASLLTMSALRAVCSEKSDESPLSDFAFLLSQPSPPSREDQIIAISLRTLPSHDSSQVAEQSVSSSALSCSSAPASSSLSASAFRSPISLPAPRGPFSTSDSVRSIYPQLGGISLASSSTCALSSHSASASASSVSASLLSLSSTTAPASLSESARAFTPVCATVHHSESSSAALLSASASASAVSTMPLLSVSAALVPVSLSASIRSFADHTVTPSVSSVAAMSSASALASASVSSPSEESGSVPPPPPPPDMTPEVRAPYRPSSGSTGPSGSSSAISVMSFVPNADALANQKLKKANERVIPSEEEFRRRLADKKAREARGVSSASASSAAASSASASFLATPRGDLFGTLKTTLAGRLKHMGSDSGLQQDPDSEE